MVLFGLTVVALFIGNQGNQQFKILNNLLTAPQDFSVTVPNQSYQNFDGYFDIYDVIIKEDQSSC
jgi:hypothetical protein